MTLSGARPGTLSDLLLAASWPIPPPKSLFSQLLLNYKKGFSVPWVSTHESDMILPAQFYLISLVYHVPSPVRLCPPTVSCSACGSSPCVPDNLFGVFLVCQLGKTQAGDDEIQYTPKKCIGCNICMWQPAASKQMGNSTQMVFITHKNFKLGPIMLKLGTGKKILEEEKILDRWTESPSTSDRFFFF